MMRMYLKRLKKRHRTWKLGKHTVVATTLSILGIFFFIAGGFLIAVAITPVPDAGSFAFREVTQSTKIYDRTGKILLYDYNRDTKREVVTINNVSPNIIKAILATEDADFYEHKGIRFTSILRAVLSGITSASLSQGGSTITQQIVKNTLLTGKKSIVRKLHEIILSLKLERVYSKNQILEIYLNTIPYGGTLYGIEAAAQTYLSKSSKDVSVTEAAYLAAMIKAPTYYAPTGTHKEELFVRKNFVLSRMQTLGLIDDATYKNSVAEKITFSQKINNEIIAPHFVFYIIDQLEKKYGQRLLMSGLKVITTLDADLEMKAESTVKKYALENEKKFKATNAALIALDPKNGQILAMVGSRNFFDKEIDGQYNATIALRQPGSTMKPFIYTLALMRGYTRNTVIFDAPTQFSTSCAVSGIFNSSPPCYAPKNYDGKFNGPMTFETALAQSRNIPAIKTLYLVGIQNAVNFARQLGLTTLGDSSQYGLTLVLGGGEVRLLDLVGAYSVFANNGIKNKEVSILEVSDSSGAILEKNDSQQEKVMVIPENKAHLMSSILSSAELRVPLYSLRSALSFPGYDVAAKSGTTDNNKDLWMVGYSPSIAIGVWAGNNNNAPINKSIARSNFGATPIWQEVMAYALTKYPKTYFIEPEQTNESLPPLLQGNWNIPDAQGNMVPHSLLYWTDKNNPQGPALPNPSEDPQFSYWEYGISHLFNTKPELFKK